MSVYDIVQGQSTLKRADWSINSAALDADMKAGCWVYKDNTGKASKTPASPANMDRSVYRPVWSGKECPDAEETGNVSTVFGEHEVETDGYVADPTLLAPARAAWALNQSVVTIDGKLVPYLSGTDLAQAILGHVQEILTGKLRVHIKG